MTPYLGDGVANSVVTSSYLRITNSMVVPSSLRFQILGHVIEENIFHVLQWANHNSHLLIGNVIRIRRKVLQSIKHTKLFWFWSYKIHITLTAVLNRSLFLCNCEYALKHWHKHTYLHVYVCTHNFLKIYSYYFSAILSKTIGDNNTY